MKSSWRGMLAIVLSFALAQTATAQGEAALATDRARVGYMAGMDVAHSIAPAASPAASAA